MSLILFKVLLTQNEYDYFDDNKTILDIPVLNTMKTVDGNVLVTVLLKENELEVTEYNAPIIKKIVNMMKDKGEYEITHKIIIKEK